VKDQVSCPHKTRGKNAVLYGLMFGFLERANEDKTLNVSVL
jgi:hypothetical protein